MASRFLKRTGARYVEAYNLRSLALLDLSSYLCYSWIRFDRRDGNGVEFPGLPIRDPDRDPRRRDRDVSDDRDGGKYGGSGRDVLFRILESEFFFLFGS